MKKKQNINKIIWILIFGIVSSIFMCPTIANASERERKTVKVGYYPVSAYQEVDADGNYSGFSYDYYIQIQKYTRWKYEFVEASYADCLKMLMNGDIDVMSGLTASPDKEEYLIFSEHSNSNTQNKLYASQDSTNLYYESYDTFDGSKVGVINGVKTEELEQYAKDYNFSFETVTFNSYDELEEALANHQVDMVCGASLSKQADVKIVARLKKQPLYYAVTKTKPEIAEELNDALFEITDNNPEFYTQMSEKYKIGGANATATFTREEAEYIAAGKQIYLVVNDNLAPLSWLDEKTGEYKGISIDVASEIEKYSGLHIQPITWKEYDDMVNKNPDVIGDSLVMTADDTAWANSRNIMMTNHIYNSTIVMVSRTGREINLSDKDTVIAVPNNYYLTFRLKDILAGKNVVYYDTVQECFDAVYDRKADVTFENSLISRYYLSMLKYTNLFIYTESGYSENLAYGVYIDADTPLLSILDKTLLCIGAEQINQIVIQYAHAEENFSLEGLYYSNPTLVIIVILLFFVLIAVIVFLRIKERNAVCVKEAEQQNHQMLEEALQAAKEASAAKSGFLSRMSHELRTPINAIRGYSDLIKIGVESENIDKEAVLENVRESVMATDYLLAIISDLLDIQAIEEDKITLVDEEIFADDYLKNILHMVQQPMDEKNIHFTFDRITKICPYYLFDGVRFQQVLLNVLYNAIKFTPKDGSIHLSVEATEYDDDKTTMVFIISDTGIGMSQEFVEKNLFQKFAQERLDLSTPYEGCGTGLAISKLLLDKMGGTISCESELGKGTTFKITITAKQIHKKTRRRANRTPINYDLPGIRVLLCEDNEMNQDMEKKILTKMHCEVDIADDGQIGVNQVKNREEHYYDIILMDIRMPNMDGLEAARAIRSLDRNDVKEIPIIAVSANAFEEDVKASLEAGMNEHLAKPVDAKILYEKISQYCRK